MKVIDLLNKIANGELEENTRFYDKYVHKEYIFKPKSYAGIYPENNARADENWYLTLESGTFRLMQEVEIIEETPEEDKKIKQIGKSYNIMKSLSYDDTYTYDMEKLIEMVQDIYNKQSEIIDRLNGE